MKSNNKTKQTSAPKEEMVFSWNNYKIMLLGVALLIVGFVLMAGGGSSDPNVFDAERLFSWRRIVLAPTVVLAGFGVVGYAIFHKDKEKNEK